MTTPANGQSSCPVHNASTHGDHPTTNSGQAITHVGNEDACPVDHTSRSSWSQFFSHAPAASSKPLSTEREVSSIPKAQDGKWVYPSEAQFFSAMQRKNHNPQAADMKTVVPIHNAVNERAWGEILKWEFGRGGDACGGVSLVNFKGKPGERSLKAHWRTLLGYVKCEAYFVSPFTFLSSYAPPFDRHDWVIDRCGTPMRYIIDFYTGHNPGSPNSNLSFFLDVRPALDSWESVKMRTERFFSRWFK